LLAVKGLLIGLRVVVKLLLNVERRF